MIDEFTSWRASQAHGWCVAVSKERDRVAALNAELAAAVASLDGLKAATYDGDRVKGGLPRDKVAEAVAAMADTLERYTERIGNSMYEIERFSRTLDRLDGTDAAILSMHYVGGRTWESIAAALHYDAGYVRYELRVKAEAALYDAMPRELRNPIPRAD